MQFDFADVKPSVVNWLIVGLMAMSFLVLAKYVVNQYPNAATNFFKPLVNQA